MGFLANIEFNSVNFAIASEARKCATFEENLQMKINNCQTQQPEAEFKEFEPRLKYGWFHLKSHSMLQYLSRRSIETGFWRI